MMSKRQAIAYGKKVGTKFYVKNSNGGLLGGYRRREDAEAAKARWEREYASDPFVDGEVRVLITEA